MKNTKTAGKKLIYKVHVVYEYDVGKPSISGSDRVFTTDALMEVLLIIIDAKQKTQHRNARTRGYVIKNKKIIIMI